MEPIAMLSADPLDILFENRNKLYGAYPLRKYYAQRLYISLGFVLSLVTVSSFLYLYIHSGSAVFIHAGPLAPDTRLVDAVIMPDRPVVPHVKPVSLKPPASVAVTTPLIVRDDKPIKPLATVDDMKIAAIGIKTSAGESDNGQLQSQGSAGVGTGVVTKDSADAKPEVYQWAEIMPEFPGGIEALKRFLLKNLRMPDTELEAGTQIRVVARFIVGEDGKVRDIELAQAADQPFNTEVKRVISKMPDWKPGMQNHRPVAVYFSLPVNFVNAE